jgi:hypothetical protein
MSVSSHPEELLAEYADGTLGPDDRARVDAHVSACDICREELDLAGSARRALEALPELNVPAGTTWPVVQRAERRRRWLPSMNPRTAWVAAGATAAAAAVIGAFIMVGPLRQAAEPGSADRSAAGGEVSGPAPNSESQFDSSEELLEARYPTYRRTAEDFDSSSINRLSRDVTVGARRALDEGFLEPPARWHANTLLAALPTQTRRALACVVRAVSPGRSLAPFSVLAASYEGEPAYVGAFLQADDPEKPYRQVVLYVVSRQDCTLRSFARQQL